MRFPIRRNAPAADRGAPESDRLARAIEKTNTPVASNSQRTNVVRFGDRRRGGTRTPRVTVKSIGCRFWQTVLVTGDREERLQIFGDRQAAEFIARRLNRALLEAAQ